MASLKLVAFLLVVLVGSLVVEARQSKSRRCGRHEHFDSCGKPMSCQMSCENKRGRVCHTACVPTCMCDGGRVRNRFNECVPMHECRQRARF